MIKHTSGASNRVADALSRRHSVLVVLRDFVPGFSTFVDLYPINSFFAWIFKDILAGKNSAYSIHGEFLFWDSRLCIPDCSL